MLLRIKIKNFLSIHQETVFDMFPNPTLGRFTGHIIQESIPLMKYAAIYGANSAGKSNFIKTFAFIKAFITSDNALLKQDSSDYKYVMAATNEEPISITIEFRELSSYYKYEFQWDKVISETLCRINTDGQESTPIFQRVGTQLISNHISDVKLAHLLLKQNPQSSILSLNSHFPLMVQKDVYNAYNWFSKTLDTITTNSSIENLIFLMQSNHKMLEFASRLFKKVGICERLNIKETPFAEWIQTKKGNKFQTTAPIDVKKANVLSARYNGRNEFVVSEKDGIKYVFEFEFIQQGDDSLSYPMDVDAQSEGTVRLLTMIPCLFNLSTRSCVYVVDEIEWSMHPLMVRTILKEMSSLGCKGQLIFSTHMPSLMNQQELLRLDEMWLTEKKNGSTAMRSLNDFIIDESMDVERAYLMGRFGGIPVAAEENEIEQRNNC